VNDGKSGGQFGLTLRKNASQSRPANCDNSYGNPIWLSVRLILSKRLNIEQFATFSHHLFSFWN